jgi:hypothetical protein
VTDRFAARRVERGMRLACMLVLAATGPALADPKPAKTHTGTLVEDPASKRIPGCGGLMVWTIVHFDLSKDPPPKNQAFKPDRVPVAVACIELTRKQMGPNAGNAGVLVKGKRYTLQLANFGTGSWGTPAFEAVRIDDAK